jgi:hypothetical protein
MKSEDMSKELWSIANIITGFSVAQALAVTFALSKDLAGLQSQNPALKITISIIALMVGAAYCFAVHQCRLLALSLDAEHDTIWRQINYGRMACIFLFTCISHFRVVCAGDIPPEIVQSNTRQAMRPNQTDVARCWQASCLASR